MHRILSPLIFPINLFSESRKSKKLKMNDVIIYRTKDNKTQIDVRFENDSV